MTEAFESDVEDLRPQFSTLSTVWNGRDAILELKEADYQWRQMEWIGWYFEHKARACASAAGFTVPGERHGNTHFDACKRLNWDFKAHAIKSHTHTLISNDVAAMESSIRSHGSHGMVVALLDVEYNDDARTFQQWHQDLKGGLSEYEISRRARTAVSRYRKTAAILREILFISVESPEAEFLSIHRQGRNSNGKARPPKFLVDLEDIPADDAIVVSMARDDA